MASFHRRETGIEIQLDEDEATLLRKLIGEMQPLLRGQADDDRTDPVIGRLFPAAYEDPEDERAFNELVGGELRATKQRSAETVATRLGTRGGVEATVTVEEADAWLACLADMRLAIGTSLQVTEEDMGREVDPSDPQAASMLVLHWLSYLQGGILETLGWSDDPQWLKEA
jgi:hypothetical protein